MKRERIEIRNLKGEKKDCEVVRLTTHIVLSGRDLSDYKSARKAVLTHAPTGSVFGLVSTTQAEALKVAQELEELLDLSFASTENMRSKRNTPAKWLEARDVVRRIQED